jgi:hypothetical protein
MAMMALEINKRQPLAEGKSFGAAGAYEQIDGTAHFGVDPTHPDNRGIADIALAPRDPTGLVRFATDVTILSSRPEGSHLRALPDPYVNLSIHTAPDVRPFPWQSRQWAKSVGCARRSRSNQSRAPLVLRRNRLNLRRAQRMT